MVSTLWEVDDLPAALLMTEFYTQITERGLEPRMALQQAQHWLRGLDCTQVAAQAQARSSDAVAVFSKERNEEAGYWAQQASTRPAAKPFLDPYYWAAYTYSGF